MRPWAASRAERMMAMDRESGDRGTPCELAARAARVRRRALEVETAAAGEIYKARRMRKLALATQLTRLADILDASARQAVPPLSARRSDRS
jgi:hypothetical protein